MRAGLIYDPTDAALTKRQAAALELLYDYNASRPSQEQLRAELLRQMLGAVGTACHIEPPFHANWGGANVYFGDHVYANFNLTVVDDAEIRVGNRVMIGPNVTISTAGHPISASSGRLPPSSIFPCASRTTFGSVRGPSFCRE